MSASHAEELEKEVRAACHAGDYDRGVTLIVQKLGPEILGFLVARMRNDGLASDVFSIFCEDVWKGLEGFQWRSTVRVWSYTLARHAADRYSVRAERRPERNVPLTQAGLSQIAEQVRAETLPHLRTNVKSRMRELREQLPESEQQLLILRVDRKMSWEELARVLAFDEAAEDPAPDQLKREAARLRKRFQLAKDKLRKLAEAEGLIPQGE